MKIWLFTLSFLAVINGVACAVQSDPTQDDEAEKTVLPYTEGIRISWDYSSLTKVYNGAAFYPRIIRLSDGRLLASFESNGGSMVAQSVDDGQTWSDHQMVAEKVNGVNAAVPELIQLKDDRIILAYNTRPPQSNTDQTKHFGIKLRVSDDLGSSWSNEINVYEGGFSWDRGVWEPVMIQRSTGELDLYFANEFPYESSNDQEISLVTSTDGGLTWSAAKTISYRSGFRDGMPVPIKLQNGGTAMAIEDNGLYGTTFKPSIIYTAGEDWPQDFADANSSRRWGALVDDARLLAHKYGGAPYLRQLPSGETILSFQSNNERPGDWDRSTMAVAIGDEFAKNFSRISEPFAAANDRAAMWNALFIKNDSTITAISSTSAYSENGQAEFYTIDGHVQRELKAPNTQVLVDGTLTDAEWGKTPALFVGARGNASISLKVAHHSDYLFIGVRQEGEIIFSSQKSNTVSVFFGTQSLTSNHPGAGTFRVDFLSAQKAELYTWSGEGWQLDAAPINIKCSQQACEVGIPTAKIITETTLQNWGITAGFYVLGNAGVREEILSGTDKNKPATWLKLQVLE